MEPNKGQGKGDKGHMHSGSAGQEGDFVLNKLIFSNVFNKDIRRIYIYRKTERLAKALQLIAPAFSAAVPLKQRLDGLAIALIDAAILPPTQSRESLARELLALSSFLSIAHSGGILSDMNADLIAREAHLLLQEVAGYEEPRLFIEDAPTLAELAKRAPDLHTPNLDRLSRSTLSPVQDSLSFIQAAPRPQPASKGHISDTSALSDRQEAIMKVLRSKGPSYIKDISMVIRDVSEKTIQRELQQLVTMGKIERAGERRWTQYSIRA